jgi:hypothetical protein
LANLVSYYLGQINATQNLNIYPEVFAAEALERAQVLDTKFA